MHFTLNPDWKQKVNAATLNKDGCTCAISYNIKVGIDIEEIDKSKTHETLIISSADLPVKLIKYHAEEKESSTPYSAIAGITSVNLCKHNPFMVNYGYIRDEVNELGIALDKGYEPDYEMKTGYMNKESGKVNVTVPVEGVITVNDGVTVQNLTADADVRMEIVRNASGKPEAFGKASIVPVTITKLNDRDYKFALNKDLGISGNFADFDCATFRLYIILPVTFSKDGEGTTEIINIQYSPDKAPGSYSRNGSEVNAYVSPLWFLVTGGGWVKLVQVREDDSQGHNSRDFSVPADGGDTVYRAHVYVEDGFGTPAKKTPASGNTFNIKYDKTAAKDPKDASNIKNGDTFSVYNNKNGHYADDFDYCKDGNLIFQITYKEEWN